MSDRNEVSKRSEWTEWGVYSQDMDALELAIRVFFLERLQGLDATKPPRVINEATKPISWTSFDHNTYLCPTLSVCLCIWNARRACPSKVLFRVSCLLVYQSRHLANVTIASVTVHIYIDSLDGGAVNVIHYNIRMYCSLFFHVFIVINSDSLQKF